MEVVGETALEIPDDTAQCVFLHHPTIFLNLKRAERWEDRSMEMGQTNKLHQIPQSQTNFLYLEEENTSSAGILLSSSFTIPLLLSLICTALKGSLCPSLNALITIREDYRA